jgi:hypothetical protein
MNDPTKTDKTQSEEETRDPLTDSVDEVQAEPSPHQSGFRARLRSFLIRMQRNPPVKKELTKDRTRSLTLLIGASVAAVLLFLGVLSNPARSPMHDVATRTPNLGKPSTGAPSTPAQGSVTPLLNADVQSNNSNSDQLSPADIRGTSRSSSEPDEIGGAERGPTNRATVGLPRRVTTSTEPLNAAPIVRPDPSADYRTNSTGAPTYSYGGSAGLRAGADSSRTYGYSGAPITPTDTRPDSPSSVKSSIVFVRTTSSTAPIGSRTAATIPVTETSLLPPGTRLAARLEAAATTAVKTPVVASIEYNYERDGVVIVPAGAKVIGDVQQASAEGYVSVRFHTLQMPNGREEKIEGTGVALDQTPLKGQVTGKNTGKKIVSRTLSGVGTIAAYMVGAGGAGLNRTITNETLLRDRVAGNIGLAGEQELMNAASAQNISVTIPANTRFYVVLQKAAVNSTPPLTSQTAGNGNTAQSGGLPTVQEIRELMELRREINRMYQESNTARPQEEKQ